MLVRVALPQSLAWGFCGLRQHAPAPTTAGAEALTLGSEVEEMEGRQCAAVTAKPDRVLLAASSHA